MTLTLKLSDSKISRKLIWWWTTLYFIDQAQFQHFDGQNGSQDGLTKHIFQLFSWIWDLWFSASFGMICCSRTSTIFLTPISKFSDSKISRKWIWWCTSLYFTDQLNSNVLMVKIENLMMNTLFNFSIWITFFLLAFDTKVEAWLFKTPSVLYERDGRLEDSVLEAGVNRTKNGVYNTYLKRISISF